MKIFGSEKSEIYMYVYIMVMLFVLKQVIWSTEVHLIARHGNDTVGGGLWGETGTDESLSH